MLKLGSFGVLALALAGCIGDGGGGGGDAGPDGAVTLDGGTGDAVSVDAQPGDGARPDGETPDARVADAVSADGAAADAATGDGAVADGGGGDECTPEECGPEPDSQRCPDGSAPEIVCERGVGGACGWRVSCPPDGGDCGGIAGLACAAHEWCDYEAQCGAADQLGVCRPRPEGCDDVYDPVCGCDDTTWPNECEANAAGVDALHAGECDGPPDICLLPIEVGPCEAAMPRWAFDPEQERCVGFVYGGCQGNENNFETLEACQAACGAPQGCFERGRDPIVVGGERTFGECLEGCNSTLTIDPSPLDVEGACDVVVLSVCDNDGPNPTCTEHPGTLTALGHGRARAIAGGLVAVGLEARYGCPDCADGGASRVTLRRLGAVSEHVYEFGNPPPELVDADGLVQGLIDALRRCEDSPDITVDPGCVGR